MKQTAVEYLLQEFSEIIGRVNFTVTQDLFIRDAVIKAREMEKEQKIDDIVQFGIKYHHKYSEGAIKKLCENAEEYYNEIYKNETK